MIKKVFKYFFLLALVSISCTKDVDFEQANDLRITPIVESDLIFIDEPASRFVFQGNEISVIKDSADIDFFKEQYVADHLIKADFFFEITNSINRGFRLQIDMYDDHGQLQHSFSISTPPSTDNSDVVTEHIEVFEGASLEALKNTTQFVFTLTLLPGDPIDESTPGRVILRSKGTFHLSFDS